MTTPLLFVASAVLIYLGAADPNPDDVQTILRDLFDAVTGSNWRYAAACVLILVVALTRRYGAKVPKIGGFLSSGVGAWITAIVLGGLTGIGNALAAGVPLGGLTGGLKVFLDGAFVGLAAAGLYSGGKAAKEHVEAKRLAKAPISPDGGEPGGGVRWGKYPPTTRKPNPEDDGA